MTHHSFRQKNIFLKNFPVPDFLSLDVVSLDIDPRTVRLMKLQQNETGYTPEVYEEVVMEDVCQILEDEQDLDRCGELREVLKKLKVKYQLEYVSVSLPEMKTYIFQTTISREALTSIDDAIIATIEENVPLDPHEVIVDYRIPEHNMKQDREKVEVVVTVLPKKIIETYTRLFNELELVPVSFRSESQALARAVVPNNDSDPYLLIHFGYEQVTVVLVEENIVHYTSSVPIDPKAVVADFNGTSAQLLKEKINKLLIYWFTNKQHGHQEEKIEQAIVTGEVASTTGCVSFFEKHLQLNVRLADVWVNCVSLNDHVPEIPRNKSLDYAVSIGLQLPPRI